MEPCCEQSYIISSSRLPTSSTVEGLNLYNYVTLRTNTSIHCGIKYFTLHTYLSQGCDPEEGGHDHVHYFIVQKLPYISMCASRGLIVIGSGMIATTFIKK